MKGAALHENGTRISFRKVADEDSTIQARTPRMSSYLVIGDLS
jgi:hypothetical protein